MKIKYLLIPTLGLLVFAAALGPIMSNVEQAKYTLIEQYGAIEIRQNAKHAEIMVVWEVL